VNESHDEQLELAQREIRALAATLHARPRQARVAPAAARGDERIEPQRLAYRIGELTDAHYRAFVEQAFHALLKRLPSEAESAVQIAALAAGATKAEVLGNLRWSPEGRRIGVRVAGLLPRYASAKARRVPVLGYLLDLFTNLAGLPQLARHQRASDALLAAGDEAAAAANHALGLRLSHLDGQTTLLRQRADDLHAHAHELAVARDALSRALVHTEEALRHRIESLEGVASAHAGRLDELAFLRQRVHAMNHWAHHLTEAFARIDVVAAEREVEPADFAARAALAVVATDHGREARNAVWADAFAAMLPEKGRVLVLASGGDWTALLDARGINVDHAEQNQGLAEAARMHGARVEPVPAEDLLSRTADDSYDGLSVLALPALARAIHCGRLFVEASRVLRAGGTLLLADAREPIALVDALLGRPPVPLAPELVAQALTLAGFVDIRRMTSPDGTPAWLAHAPS
jgi:hypothetical protein